MIRVVVLALLLAACPSSSSPPPDAPPPTCLELGVPPSQPLLCTQAGLCTLADGRICTREVTP